jgi:four helix bundle protein
MMHHETYFFNLMHIGDLTMQEEKGFKKLTVWQMAYGLVLMIYKHSQKFPSSELYGLSSQIRRASVSILANIAEGSERQHKKEFVQFLSIARGSLAEVETYLILAKDLGYLNEDEFFELEKQRKDVGRLLRGLYKSLS